MTLTLAIPVWNDAEALVTLLHQATAMGCFDRVIVVDDGSDPAIDAENLPFERCLLLRHDSPKGAGAARNLALDHIETSHVLFFDSDDHLLPDVAALWRDLQDQPFDFCIAQHNDSQVLARGGWGQMEADNALWRLAGCASGALTRPSPAQAALLAETTNYPWNKIYRTAFLREHDIRFSEVPVHNDIAAHWLGFVHADRVLASDRKIATHFVRRGGDRLTNRRGSERLQVFSVFDDVAHGIADVHSPKSDLMRAFLRFATDLINWIRGIIDAPLIGALDTAVADFVRRALPPEAFAWIVRADPVLALRLNLLMTARAA